MLPLLRREYGDGTPDWGYDLAGLRVDGRVRARAVVTAPPVEDTVDVRRDGGTGRGWEREFRAELDWCDSYPESCRCILTAVGGGACWLLG